MKKALIIVVILLVAGFAISYYFIDMFGPWAKHPKKITTKAELQKAATAAAPELLSYVPSSAAMCAHFTDIAALKTAIQESDYFKQLSATPFWQKNIPIAEKQLEQSLRASSLETAVKVESPDLGLLWDLVGDEIAIAFTPAKSPETWAILFLAKVKSPAKLDKIAKAVVDALENKGFTSSEIKYHAETIKKLAIKGAGEVKPSGSKNEPGSLGHTDAVEKTELYLCQTHRLLTGATDLAALKSVIDLLSGDKKDCLATAANYTEVASQLRPGHFGEVYMKLGVDWANVFTALGSDTNASPHVKAEGMPKMAGDSLTRLYVKDGIQFEAYTALDVEKSDASIVDFYKFQPNSLPLLSTVPWGSTLMFVMNCLSARETYELALNSATSQNPMAAVMISGFITELEKKIGASITDDLLPAVGPDIALYYKGINFKQDLPLPEFGFVCSSTNPEKLINVFPQIGDYLMSFAKEKAPKVEHENITYKGYPVHVVRLAIPVGKSPTEMSIAAAVVDNRFCVGFGLEQVKTIIDCIGYGHPLLKDQPEYKAISEGYPEKVNQTVFLDFNALWQQIKSLLELYAQVNAPEKKEAFQFVDTLLKPVKTLFTTSLYEHPSPKTVVQRSYGHIKIEEE